MKKASFHGAAKIVSVMYFARNFCVQYVFLQLMINEDF